MKGHSFNAPHATLTPVFNPVCGACIDRRPALILKHHLDARIPNPIKTHIFYNVNEFIFSFDWGDHSIG